MKVCSSEQIRQEYMILYKYEQKFMRKTRKK